MAELPPELRTLTRRYWSAKRLAEHFDVSVSTVKRMADRGDLPKPVKLSEGVVRWDMTEIEAHLGRPRRGPRYDNPDEASMRMREARHGAAARR